MVEIPPDVVATPSEVLRWLELLGGPLVCFGGVEVAVLRGNL